MLEPIRVMRIITRMNIGGPAQHVTLLSADLNDADFHSTLVTGPIGPNEGNMSDFARAHGVEPVFIPQLRREISPLGDQRALIALMRLIRCERPHIVHTHTAKAGFLGRLAAWLCGVPVILHTFHGHVFKGYFSAPKTRLFIALERLTAHLSDVILTVSERLRQELIDLRIAPPSRIRVVSLGLELSPFLQIDALRGRFRSELGLSTDSPLVGIIGRLVPIKNHDLFLEAARHVRECLPNAHFVVIGDGERLSDLHALAEQLGLAKAVSFTGWRSDLPTIYADLDTLVISSRNEGTPVSAIEAMAAGVPIVATQVGGVPDLLQDGALGALVPSDDVGAMAEAIIETLQVPQTQRLTEARAWVLAHYSAERLCEDARTLYRTLLQDKRR